MKCCHFQCVLKQGVQDLHTLYQKRVGRGGRYQYQVQPARAVDYRSRCCSTERYNQVDRERESGKHSSFALSNGMDGANRRSSHRNPKGAGINLKSVVSRTVATRTFGSNLLLSMRSLPVESGTRPDLSIVVCRSQ
jgi:hypothetical protein